MVNKVKSSSGTAADFFHFYEIVLRKSKVLMVEGTNLLQFFGECSHADIAMQSNCFFCVLRLVGLVELRKIPLSSQIT
jgi:hypothetical protein